MLRHFLLICFAAVSGVYAQSKTVAPKAQVLVVYHSESGQTHAMAEAVMRGANVVGGVAVLLRTTSTVSAAELQASDAIIIGSPVINANPSPEVLSFIRSWPFKEGAMKNKIGSAFATGGGISAGEELVQVSLLHAMLVFGMVVVGGDEWTSSFGASAVTGEKPFDESKSVNAIFIRKAERLGRRVAEAALRWKED